MTTRDALLVLAITAFGTFWFRGGLILLLADRSLAPPIERSLRYVGPAVLASLTVSLAVGGNGATSIGPPEAAGIAVSCLVAWRTRNLLWTLVAGMATLLLVGAF